MNDHFEVIIVGTGATGSSLLNLALERGPFLLRELDNRNYHGSFKCDSSLKGS